RLGIDVAGPGQAQQETNIPSYDHGMTPFESDNRGLMAQDVRAATVRKRLIYSLTVAAQMGMLRNFPWGRPLASTVDLARLPSGRGNVFHGQYRLRHLKLALHRHSVRQRHFVRCWHFFRRRQSFGRSHGTGHWHRYRYWFAKANFPAAA